MAPRSMESDPAEGLARSFDLLLRLKIEEIKGDRSQREMIRMLGAMGATAPEIASLLRISLTTVAPELSKARTPKKKKNSSASAPSKIGFRTWQSRLR